MGIRKAWILFPLLGLLFFQTFLLRAGSHVYGSPDETAAAVAVQTLAIERRISPFSPLKPSIPFLHPRSWVTLNGSIVPVGFLGWPYVLSRLSVIHLQPDLLAVLIIASGIFPFFFLLERRFGTRSALLGAGLVYTFPLILLYSNRFYFSNLPQIVFLLWSIFFLSKSPLSIHNKYLSFFLVFISGLFFSIVLSIRPSEWFWVIPLFIYFFYVFCKESVLSSLIPCLLGFAIYLIPFLLFNKEVYGSFLTVGYLIHDPLYGQAQVTSTVFQVATVQAFSFINLLRSFYQLLMPYGFHPRVIYFNVYHFLVLFLWPWTAFFVISAVLFFKRISKGSFPWKVLFICSIPLVLLFSIYGSGLYTDSLKPNDISLGNSFLRYLMPLYFAGGVLISFVHKSLSSFKWRTVYEVLCLGLMIAGLLFAFYRSNESLVPLKQELVRYEHIRQESKLFFQRNDVILSSRSDKIFFPVFQAISPLPDLSLLRPLAQGCHCSLGWFDRPFSSDQIERIHQAGFEIEFLEAFGNESLYRLKPL